MTHCSDDELLVEYYGESAPSAHLAACAECATRYRLLKTTLDGLTLEAPERGEHYGLEVWQAIRHRLPAHEPWWHSLLVRRGFAAAAAVLLLVTGFAAGRFWPSAESESLQTRSTSADGSPQTSSEASDEEARRRVVLMTVSDHFDRSDRVLAEIMNAPGPRDLAAERQWAGDLVAASRLYRQDVIAINEPAVAGVLEEVERVLLDIVHQPSTATAAELDDIRRRIDSAALLFKVRVMQNELQQRLEEPASPATVTTSTIG
jgi:hypothetical protein